MLQVFIKCLKENIGESFMTRFLRYTPKAKGTKVKTYKLYYIGNKNYCVPKDAIDRVKR